MICFLLLPRSIQIVWMYLLTSIQQFYNNGFIQLFYFLPIIDKAAMNIVY